MVQVKKNSGSLLKISAPAIIHAWSMQMKARGRLDQPQFMGFRSRASRRLALICGHQLLQYCPLTVLPVSPGISRIHLLKKIFGLDGTTGDEGLGLGCCANGENTVQGRRLLISSLPVCKKQFDATAACSRGHFLAMHFKGSFWCQLIGCSSSRTITNIQLLLDLAESDAQYSPSFWYKLFRWVSKR